MTDKRAKRWSEEKRYIEILKENPQGLTRVGIRRQTEIKVPTEQAITKRLLKCNAIVERELWDMKGKKTVKAYRLVALEDLASHDELNSLMKFYKQALSDKNMQKLLQVQLDIVDICQHKKVRDKEFITFLVEEVKKMDVNTRDMCMECLGHVATSLLKSIETEEYSLDFISGHHEKQLLDIVYTSVDFLAKVILTIGDISDFQAGRKNSALDGFFEFANSKFYAFLALERFDHPRKFEVVFELLSKVSTKDQYRTIVTPLINAIVRDLVLLYAEVNPLRCRQKLYSLLTSKTNKELEREVIGLLARIRIGCTNKEYKDDY